MTEKWFNFRDITIEKIREYPATIREQINDVCNAIVAVKERRTYENTIRPIINVHTKIQPLINSLEYIQNFYTNAELRETACEILKVVNKDMIDCELRQDIYDAFSEYCNRSFHEEKHNLTPEEIRCFEHELRDCRRNGLHLSSDMLERIKNIKKELSEISISFDRNLNEDVTSFTFTRDDLAGMPEYWFNDNEKLIANDKENKTYRVTLKYPDYFPAMDYVISDDVRKKIYMAYQSRCQQENTPLLDRAIRLRHELAQILGYSTHADFVTEVNIVKNAESAINFLKKMHSDIEPYYQRDIETLLEYAQTHGKYPLKKKKFNLWDMRFYSRLYQEHVCDFNKDEMRKYFPLDVVKSGMFDIYQRLLSVKFTEIPTDNKWHEDVTLYSVTDCETNELMGYFYLDMYPREGKYGHAAVFQFMSSCEIISIEEMGKDHTRKRVLRQPHIVAMACNFPKEECLPHDDVETFFHEFGHVMHQICSRPQLKDFSGLCVETDFVEALSQFLEFWCYCEKSLTIMNTHETTREKIPKHLIDKLRASKKILSSIHYIRQLLFGIYDLRMHTIKDFTNFDVKHEWLYLESQLYGMDSIEHVVTDNYAPYSNFSHIIGGYDAGYYGYLLTDTFAANMFYKMFGDENVLDSVRGLQYRKRLLEPGASRDGMELLEEYLGEKPSIDYFLQDRGFTAN